MARMFPTLFRAFDANGNPLAGGKLYSYETGTTTPKVTHTTQVGDVDNANPVILDANGEASVWLSVTGGYKLNLTDADDVQQDNWPIDGIFEDQESGGDTDIEITDNTDPAFRVREDSNNYIHISTTNASESLSLGNATTDPDISILGSGDFVINTDLKLSVSSNDVIFENTSAGSLNVRTTGGDIVFKPQDVALTVATDLITVASGTVMTLNDITISDNTAAAIKIRESSNNYLNFDTTDASEAISLGNTTTNPAFNLLGSGDLTVGTGAVTLNGSLTIGKEIVRTPTIMTTVNDNTNLDWVDTSYILIEDVNTGATSHTVGFVNGQSGQFVTVAVNDDSAIEIDDTVGSSDTISLSSGSVTYNTLTLTINQSATFVYLENDAVWMLVSHNGLLA